jgi:hypothetical protein
VNPSVVMAAVAALLTVRIQAIRAQVHHRSRLDQWHHTLQLAMSPSGDQHTNRLCAVAGVAVDFRTCDTPNTPADRTCGIDLSHYEARNVLPVAASTKSVRLASTAKCGLRMRQHEPVEIVA